MLYSTVVVAIFYMIGIKCEDDTNFVHQVLIVAADGGVDDHCGGALIKYDWAVTSLRCIEKLFKDFLLIEVVAGFDEKQENYKEIRNTSKYIKHVNNNKLYDLAFVQVNPPFTQSKELRLVRLPNKGEEICNTGVVVSVFTEKTNPRQFMVSSTTLKKLGRYFFKQVIKSELKVILSENTKAVSGDLLVKSKGQLQEIVNNKLRDPHMKRLMYQAIEWTVTIQGIKNTVKNVKTRWKEKFIFSRRKKTKWWWWIWGGRRKRDEDGLDTEAVFTGVLPKVHPKTCAGSKGWSLYCGNTIFGIEAECQQSNVRSSENVATFVDIEEDLDLILAAIGLDIQTRSSVKSETNFKHSKNRLKKLFLFLLITQFLYVF